MDSDIRHQVKQIENFYRDEYPKDRGITEATSREKRAIEQQNQWLANTLEETHELITRLFQELDTILAPEPEDPSTNYSGETLGTSQFFFSLRDRTATAGLANDRLRTILRTIEL